MSTTAGDNALSTLKVDLRLPDSADAEVLRAAASRAEAVGYDGILAREQTHDPFLALALASTATTDLRLATSIAVGFARNPMSLAYLANDLATMSRGRFVLGLGTQVRPHIERRFSMPWESPAARMHEMIRALRAIWASWADGTRLEFEGDYFRHTLMTPAFVPEASGFAPPKIMLAAVGKHMVRTAGQVADGLLTHAFTTAGYIAEVVVPALSAELADRGLERSQFEINGPVLVATGANDEEVESAIAALRATIAFYASTPAYHPVLEHHGLGELGTELHTLSKRPDADRWDTMASLVGDELLGLIGVVGTPAEVASGIRARAVGTWDRIALYSPAPLSDPVSDQIAAALRAG